MATSSIDLMILGALKEQSMSAYDMDKFMEARALRKWVRVSSPSIYRNLLKLCRAGFVEGTVVREGAAPEKTVYTITEAGRGRFDELMQDVAHATARVDFEFVSVIANLYVTDEATGRALLATLREQYREQAERLTGWAPEVPRLEARANLELRAATYELVVDWLDKFERDFYRPGVPAELRGWAPGMVPPEELARYAEAADATCGADAPAAAGDAGSAATASGGCDEGARALAVAHAEGDRTGAGAGMPGSQDAATANGADAPHATVPPTFDWDAWRADYERRHAESEAGGQVASSHAAPHAALDAEREAGGSPASEGGRRP